MNEQVHQTVRNAYAGIAAGAKGCGCGAGKKDAACGSSAAGYTDAQLGQAPSEANLGLGCGNPTAIAALRPGQTVLDLGSGAGFDCFLAATKVGPTGRVIGVDMTPEMVDKARAIARGRSAGNVEFRLGEIENLPVGDNQVDIVISNCVINLSPAKERVFREAFRVLKPGGRLMVSDIVLKKDLPEEIKNSIAAYTACVAGAARKEKYLDSIRAAGFQGTKVLEETNFPLDIAESDPMAKAVVKTLGSAAKARELASSIASIKVYAQKP